MFCVIHTPPLRMFLSRFRSIQLVKKYNELVETGGIRADPRQLPVIHLLENLGNRLETRGVGQIFSRPVVKSNWGFGSHVVSSGPLEKSGLYIYGGCGTGKTMLMDLFFDEVNFKSKKRIHFHEFMLDVHARLHTIQRNESTATKAHTTWTAVNAESQRLELGKKSDKKTDPVLRIADEIFDETQLLCFDEFQVTFISDAIIMRRLFSHMFQRGIAIVATSNRPPDDLYLNGLNRELFAPFIPLLKEYCIVHNMDSEVDYRQMTTADDTEHHKVIFNKTDDLEKKFFRLVKSDCESIDITVQGRCVSVRRAARHQPIALFSFHELCDRPLGSADYITIAKKFHTIFIEGIPQLNILEHRDWIRRFITLVDALYDNHVKLVLSIKSPDIASILHIDPSMKKTSTMDEVFAWDRTLSRLTEMTSVEYQQEHAKRFDNVVDKL